MKKIAACFSIILLMMSILGNFVNYATEQPEALPELETVEENTPISTASTIQAMAVVIEAGEVKEQNTDHEISKAQEVKIEILDGKYEAKEFTIDYLFSYYTDEKNTGYQLEVGDKLQVQIVEDESGNASVTIQEIVRNTYLVNIFAIFLVLVLLIAGKQAIKVIVDIGIIILAVYFILLKGIMAGHSVVLATMLTAMVILFFHAILTVGWNKKALTVSFATFISVLMSGMIMGIFSHFAKLSGTREDTILLGLNMSNVNFDFKELIFSAMVIASLGICMNMSISLVTKLDDLKNKTEDMSWKTLFKAGKDIGAKQLGTMIQTFLLAYLGSCLTILFMFLACNMRIKEIFNKESMAESAISVMAGSIGIVLAMPITALCYSLFNHKKTIYKTTSDNKLDGNRSLRL